MKKLDNYRYAVESAVFAAGYSVSHSKVYRTKIKREVVVKTLVRKVNGRGKAITIPGCKFTPVSYHTDEKMRQAVIDAMAKQGYMITKVRSSAFWWGRGGMHDPAVSFYFEPKTA